MADLNLADCSGDLQEVDRLGTSGQEAHLFNEDERAACVVNERFNRLVEIGVYGERTSRSDVVRRVEHVAHRLDHASVAVANQQVTVVELGGGEWLRPLASSVRRYLGLIDECGRTLCWTVELDRLRRGPFSTGSNDVASQWHVEQDALLRLVEVDTVDDLARGQRRVDVTTAVFAVSTLGLVEAVAAVDDVIASSTPKDVWVAATSENVVASATREAVFAVATEKVVVAVAAEQHVVVVAAGQTVVF